MQGSALFRASADGEARYYEQGRLRLPQGQEIDATREYLYRQHALGFAVFFVATPPRLFQEVVLSLGAEGRLAGEAAHLCGDDHYKSRYEFLTDRTFLIEHEVHGPRKDYMMTTRFLWRGE
jgi:Family of unknown function (DUF6314)